MFIFKRETELERGRERGRHRIRSRIQALGCQHRVQGRAPGPLLHHHLLTWGMFLNLSRSPFSYVWKAVIKLIVSFLNYLFLRETEHEQGRTEREGDTESEAGSRLWADSTEPDARLELRNCEVMTWAEVRHFTKWAPQAPLNNFKVVILPDLKWFSSKNERRKRRDTFIRQEDRGMWEYPEQVIESGENIHSHTYTYIHTYIHISYI